MSVDCDALVGYGYITYRRKIEDAMSFTKDYNFWDFLDDYYNNLREMSAYVDNPDVFIGKKIYEEDLNELVANPSIIDDWKHEAYTMYRHIFKEEEIPEPKFIIDTYWH